MDEKIWTTKVKGGGGTRLLVVIPLKKHFKPS